ncbi:MAG: hypothetical protein WC934_13045 [Acidithiobacillus sp.]|jgi:hypothetical protein|uniref:hypothetical protein n=1 Tax=Acidithiobacillus sp. TaxID=1872118 RepID=UPI00355F01F5
MSKLTAMQQALVNANLVSNDDLQRIEDEKRKNEEETRKKHDDEVRQEHENKQNSNPFDPFSIFMEHTSNTTIAKHEKTRYKVHTLFDPLYMKWKNRWDDVEPKFSERNIHCCICGKQGKDIFEIIEKTSNHTSGFVDDPNNKGFSYLFDSEMKIKYFNELREKLGDTIVMIGDVKILNAQCLGILKICKSCFGIIISTGLKEKIIIESHSFLPFSISDIQI